MLVDDDALVAEVNGRLYEAGPADGRVTCPFTRSHESAYSQFLRVARFKTTLHRTTKPME